MTDREAMWASCAAGYEHNTGPDDDRLILADWLDENGTGEAAVGLRWATARGKRPYQTLRDGKKVFIWYDEVMMRQSYGAMYAPNPDPQSDLPTNVYRWLRGDGRYDSSDRWKGWPAEEDAYRELGRVLLEWGDW